MTTRLMCTLPIAGVGRKLGSVLFVQRFGRVVLMAALQS